MFSGESVTVKLVTGTYMMDDLIDWFGRDFSVVKKDDCKIEVTLKCNEQAMKFWAVQYGENVEILSPQSLRKSLEESVRGMYETYCKVKGEAK